jgi:hypothetical protein
MFWVLLFASLSRATPVYLMGGVDDSGLLSAAFSVNATGLVEVQFIRQIFGLKAE